MPARDPFYKTRAAEIAANIMLAELDLFKGSVFTELDSFCTGEVIAKTRAGNTLILTWDWEHQCIMTVDYQPNPYPGQVEVRIAA